MTDRFAPDPFKTPENAEWNEAGGRVAVLVKRRRRASRFSSAWRAGMKKKTKHFRQIQPHQLYPRHPTP